MDKMSNNRGISGHGQWPVASQRNHVFPMLAILLVVSLIFPSWGNGAPEIILPELFAVELPPGKTSLGVDEEPLKGLIATARAEGHRVTAILPRDRLGPGIWRVIWSAWGEGASNYPVARRESFLFVLPFGMTPVGVSGYSNATAGNNTTHIGRDASGFVHMVWGDAWRPGWHEGARYRRGKVLPDGTVAFETEIVDLAPNPGDWRAMPSLAVVGDTIHFTWQADGTARYRFLTREGTAWSWSSAIDTRAVSPGRDTGPAIAADASGVHILTPDGTYTTSHDGGRTWITETVPFGTVARVKTASLTLDSAGRPLAAASVVVKDAPAYSEERGSGGYWTLRLARRLAAGAWETVQGPLDGRPEWTASDQPSEDVLSDWVRVLEDRTGGMHATWHGTAVSRIYGNDRAYYAWRPPGGAWRPPISLREPEPRNGFGWSYAPGLTLDADKAMPLVFFAMQSGWRLSGFDADLGLFRDGMRIAPALPVTRFAREAIVSGEMTQAFATWFPTAAPSLVRSPDGRIWIDILMTLAPSGAPSGVAAPAVIVWRRLDVTDWLNAARQ